MRRTGGRLAIAVLAVVGVYLFQPAFGAPEFQEPDHAALSDHLSAVLSETRDDILSHVDRSRGSIVDVLTDQISGNVSVATRSILDSLDARAVMISGNVAGATRSILDSFDVRTTMFSANVAGGIDTILARLAGRTNDLSGTIAGSRDTILARIAARANDISAGIGGSRDTILAQLAAARQDLSGLVRDRTLPAIALADRTNTYRNWLFAAGETGPEKTLVFTLFSDSAQTVRATFFTDRGTVGPIDLSLRSQVPFVLNVNQILGERQAITTRLSGGSAFYVERTFTTRGAVVITSGEHD